LLLIKFVAHRMPRAAYNSFIGEQRQSDSQLPKESGVPVKTAALNISCVPGF